MTSPSGWVCEFWCRNNYPGHLEQQTRSTSASPCGKSFNVSVYVDCLCLCLSVEPADQNNQSKYLMRDPRCDLLVTLTVSNGNVTRFVRWTFENSFFATVLSGIIRWKTVSCSGDRPKRYDPLTYFSSRIIWDQTWPSYGPRARTGRHHALEVQDKPHYFTDRSNKWPYLTFILKRWCALLLPVSFEDDVRFYCSTRKLQT